MEGITDTIKKLPSWAWYAVGGIVLVVLILLFMRGKSPAAQQAAGTAAGSTGGAGQVVPVDAGPSTSYVSTVYSPTTTTNTTTNTTTSTQSSSNYAPVNTSSLQAGGNLTAAIANQATPALSVPAAVAPIGTPATALTQPTGVATPAPKPGVTVQSVPAASTAGTLGIPFAASGATAQAAPTVTASAPAPALTAADVKAAVLRDGELWKAANQKGDATGMAKAHDDAMNFRNSAAAAGLGTLVDHPAGYKVLQLPDGTQI